MASLNKCTLTEQIYQILKRDIIEQNIKCGEKLTLKMLKERFEVSSTPVREALTKLIQDNLVTYYSNIGVKVIEFTKKDVEDIFEFIKELDSLAVKFAMQNENREELVETLKNNLEENLKCINLDSLKQASDFSDEFHTIFYNFCDNSRLIDAFKRINLQLSILIVTYEYDKENQIYLLEQHKKIYEAVASGDCELAMERMRTHIEKSFDLVDINDIIL